MYVHTYLTNARAGQDMHIAFPRKHAHCTRTSLMSHVIRCTCHIQVDWLRLTVVDADCYSAAGDVLHAGRPSEWAGLDRGGADADVQLSAVRLHGQVQRAGHVLGSRPGG